MKVICISRDNYVQISVGVTYFTYDPNGLEGALYHDSGWYDPENHSNEFVDIINNNGDRCSYPKRLFTSIQEIRDNKLTELGIV